MKYGFVYKTNPRQAISVRRREIYGKEFKTLTSYRICPREVQVIPFRNVRIKPLTRKDKRYRSRNNFIKYCLHNTQDFFRQQILSWPWFVNYKGGSVSTAVLRKRWCQRPLRAAYVLIRGKQCSLFSSLPWDQLFFKKFGNLASGQLWHRCKFHVKRKIVLTLKTLKRGSKSADLSLLATTGKLKNKTK